MNFQSKILGAALALSCGAANAVTIQTVTTSPGLMTTVNNVCTVTFNTPGTLTACSGASYSAGSAGHIVSGNLSGQYAQPAGDATPYLFVGPGIGSVTITIAAGANYFGFYAGSIDSYNSLTFTPSSGPALTLSGTDIAAILAGSPANGSANAYFNFFTNGLFTSVTLASSQNAFETDNHSFGVIPEPGSVALLGLGALALVAGKRRRAK